MIRQATEPLRWVIDDTAGITEGRVFVVHLEDPSFVAELIPEDEAPISGLTVSAPFGQVLCNIHWLHEPGTISSEMIQSLTAAINHHWNTRR